MSGLIDSSSISIRLEAAAQAVDEALRRSHRTGPVRILAVTKTMPVEVILDAMAAGISRFGENRVSEGGRKVAAVGRDAAEFHLIGPLHRREARQAVRDFDWIDSIDRPEILTAVLERSGRGDRGPLLLLEVNTTPGEAKHGFDTDPGLIETLLSSSGAGPAVRGLMTVGPLGGGEGASRRAFERLRILRDDLERRTGLRLPELSMGMSDDFGVAVEEGATMVRLGRFLFGPRRPG